MQNHSFKHVIKHDLTIGIRQNAPKYIIAILACSFFCMLFFNNVSVMQQSGQVLEDGSLMDCSIFLFRGMAVYIPSQQNPFQIPIIWLIIQVLVALLVVSYPTEDLHSYGTQILTRAKNRSVWWFSKCIWNGLTTMSFYLVVFMVVFVFTIIFGKLSFLPDQLLNQLINEINLKNVDIGQLSFALLLLPMLTSIAFSQLQMTLSFILTPIYSFFIIVCIFVASAYFCMPVFIGNFSMLLRNQLVCPQGTGSIVAIIINLSVTIISIVIGYVHFSKCDILKKS
ncbi:MAG: hypothetical protein PHV07_08040 [Oscillospiraceae bacterium]|nr:hypothetical protein [Oscillospiraceae bacterium]